MADQTSGTNADPAQIAASSTTDVNRTANDDAGSEHKNVHESRKRKYFDEGAPKHGRGAKRRDLGRKDY